MKVRFKLLSSRAVAPWNVDGNAGSDLFAPCELIIQARYYVKLDLELAVEIPEGYEGDIRGRSGLIASGYSVINTGTIDSSYRGSIGVVLINHNERGRWHIAPGDRIAQLVIFPCPAIQWEAAAELTETTRGTKGFGSTGR